MSKSKYQEPDPKVFEPLAFESIVRARRSVRVYENEAIPAETMQKLFELSLLAPNSSNLQPWEIIWVRTPEKKAELARICLSQSAARTASELVVFVSHIDRWRWASNQMVKALDQQEQKSPKIVYTYYKKLTKIGYAVGPLNLFGGLKNLLSFFLSLRKPFPTTAGSRADLRVWAAKSTALACENFMLGARAFGYDTCPMEGFDGFRLRRFLKLRRGAEVSMVISIGKRAPSGVYGAQLRFDSKHFIREILSSRIL